MLHNFWLLFSADVSGVTAWKSAAKSNEKLVNQKLYNTVLILGALYEFFVWVKRYLPLKRFWMIPNWFQMSLNNPFVPFPVPVPLTSEHLFNLYLSYFSLVYYYYMNLDLQFDKYVMASDSTTDFEWLMVTNTVVFD